MPTDSSLSSRLPRDRKVENDEVLELFLAHVADSGLSLYPAQEEAILELYDGKNLILNTPTGSGKSLVATALHFQSLARGRRSVYSSPIKALVNEKFFALCRDFGADKVGLVTGDATVNGEAPIICCTAEILSNWALREGVRTPFEDVVMDEFHYYSDRERGVAWQIPLLTLEYSRFLLMSATLGDVAFFEEELKRLTGRETVTVRTTERPVPLEFEYREVSLHHTLEELVEKNRAPVYVVSFTQRECAEEAQNILSVDLSTKEEKAQIQALLEGARFDSPYGRDIHRLLRHGIGIHHGGLLPKYRILVEKIAQKGLLKVICGTDTLGVGVNIPIRTVLFTKLSKFDGQKTSLLSVRDFQQISGRAGRKGFDERGYVVSLAPEHVIENRQIADKIAADPKKAKKLVRKKPPEKGFVGWDQNVFNRLIQSQPEALQSRFSVSHGMILQVLSRADDGCRALQKIIRDSHEKPHAKKEHRKRAFQLFRALVDRHIIEFLPNPEPGLSKLRLNVDLQQDFSLNQALSLYLLDTIKLLDRDDPDYALNVLTLVESILENPELILRKQLDALKGQKIAELKEAGVEYDQRMEELEKLEYPKPLRDFVYDTFNRFAADHPWVGQENIRPKSVAREMYEAFGSFAEYVRDYEIQRAEGLLLRYLSEVYRALSQTVPVAAKNDAVIEMETYFREMVRNTDSSLVDEWEKMRDPGWRQLASAPTSQASAPDAGIDLKALTISIRNSVFSIVRALSRSDFESALALMEGASEAELKQALEAYFEENSVIATTAQARHPQFTQIKRDAKTWSVVQVLSNDDDATDWVIELELDLARSASEERPVLVFKALEAR